MDKKTYSRTPACLECKSLHSHCLCCSRGASPASDCLADHPARAPGARLPPRNMTSLAAARPVQELGCPPGSVIASGFFSHAQLQVHDEKHICPGSSGTAEPALCPWPGPGNSGACGLVPAPTFLARQLLACSTHTVVNSFPEPVLSQENWAVSLGTAQDFRVCNQVTTHRP